LEPLKCLKSFGLRGVWGVDRVEGLEGLKNLIHFTWWNRTDDSCKRGEKVHTHVGQFPASLLVLGILDFEVFLEPDVLVRCTKLYKVILNGIRADNLDLSHCSSLQSVELVSV
jgi:hypothetical protein